MIFITILLTVAKSKKIECLIEKPSDLENCIAARPRSRPQKAQTFSQAAIRQIFEFYAYNSLKPSFSQFQQSVEKFDQISDYGCFCDLVSASWKNTRGSPVDLLDKACQKWKSCKKCVEFDDRMCSGMGDFLFLSSTKAVKNSLLPTKQPTMFHSTKILTELSVAVMSNVRLPAVLVMKL